MDAKLRGHGGHPICQHLKVVFPIIDLYRGQSPESSALAVALEMQDMTVEARRLQVNLVL